MRSFVSFVALAAQAVVVLVALGHSASAQISATQILSSYVDVNTSASASPAWFSLQSTSTAYVTNPLTLPAFGGANLGSFVQGSQAFITNAEMDGLGTQAANITGATMSFAVDAAAAQTNIISPGATNAAFTDAAGNAYSANLAQSLNLNQFIGLTPRAFLQGFLFLSPTATLGPHTLTIYTTLSAGQGGSVNTNVFAAANFTVVAAPPAPVPEPPTTILIASGIALATVARRRIARRPRR